MGFFPPNKNYYSDLLQNESFKLFLMSYGTTKEGQDRIANYYQVGELWEQMDTKMFIWKILPTVGASQNQ